MEKRKHEYPSFVDKEKIEIEADPSDKNESVLYQRRFSLRVPFKGDTGIGVAVILKNPSKATKAESDHTINRVLNYIHSQIGKHKLFNSISHVSIVNTMSIYETNSCAIKAAIASTSCQYVIGNEGQPPKNDNAINEAIAGAKIVILAWGNRPKGLAHFYDKRVQEVMKIVHDKSKNKHLLFVDKLSKRQRQPKHAQVWGYNDKLIACKITKDKGKYCIEIPPEPISRGDS